MADNITRLPLPRAVRPATPPLGLYFRPGWNEHKDVLTALETGKTGFFGAVFDPARMRRQKELRDRVLALRLDAILDPRTQASATPGGYNDELGALPWGVGHQHALTDFKGEFQQRKLIGSIGDFAVDHGFTAVMSPTHVIQSANDPWLSTDGASVRFLRNHLDRKVGTSIPIFYSLALSTHAFRDADQRQAIVQALTGLPISTLWVKVDGFGSHASPTAARIHIDALADFHQLGIPLIADHVGGLMGLSLLAFGSAGGIAHGITSGERFNAKSWMRPKAGTAFSASKRVYLPSIDMLLKPAEAKALLESSPRSRAMFGCSNPECCPRGVTDMLQNPGRHFICQRIDEVGGLSRIPTNMRTQRFLDQQVRSTTDKALAAANIKWTNVQMAKKTQEHRKRLDNLRIALGNQAAKHPPQSFSTVPQTRAARES